QPLSTSPTALTDPTVVKNYVIKFNSRGLTIQKNSVNNLICTTGDGKPRLPASVDSTCTNYTNGRVVGSEQIKGFVSVHTAVMTKDEKSEYWAAPSLGCIVLKESRQLLDAGQWTGRTVTEALSASTEAPPATYFEIPANAREARPTEYMTALTPAMSPTTLNRMEMKYDRDRASRAQ
ncbi:MAG TPA: hypothetical protein VLX58_10795, partial [Bryobacteraceae bacterium]|nr:hypothetical protein [Bryobacteraceae bacterium]